MDISVIIPVYNTESYLSRCIDSVIQQANISLEIILVDDGSTDSSPDICDTYAREHNNIKVFHIQNCGCGMARTEGFKHASGSYVTFTDSDDKMEPFMLQKMVTAGYENNADIVCCNYKEIDEYGKVTPQVYSNKQYILNHEEGLIHFYSKDKIFSQVWTKIYKRKFLIENNIENDSRVLLDEDIIFNIKAFSAAQITVIIDEPLYEYTYRERSAAHGIWFDKRIVNQFVDDRIRRVQIAINAVKKESLTVQNWNVIHNVMYYNELLGKVAPFPELYSDKRIMEVFKYIKQNKRIVNKYYNLCGFSKLGSLLLLYLPSNLYMKYRHSKI